MVTRWFRLKSSALGEFVSAAGKWAYALVFGPVLGLGNLIAYLLPGEQSWDPPVKLVYLSWVIGIAIVALAAFVSVRRQRDQATKDLRALQDTRAVIRFGDRPYVGAEALIAAEITKQLTTHQGLTYEFPSSQRVSKDSKMLFGLVDVINDPPNRHPEATAGNVFATVLYEAVGDDGSLTPLRREDHGVWHGPPTLGPDAAQRDRARFRDLLPNGDLHRLMLFRHNGHGFYACHPGSFQRISPDQDPVAIDDKWQLTARQYQITVVIKGSNMDDQTARFHPSPSTRPTPRLMRTSSDGGLSP